jgi:hypothetical protein
MPSTQDEQPVETFSPDCPDPPFRVGVRPGCPHRRPQNPNAFTAENVVKGLREFAVSVAHEEPEVSCRLRELDGKVSGLLRDPRAVRMRCAAAEVHAPAAQLNEEHYGERLQPHRLDGEEVTGDDARRLLA